MIPFKLIRQIFLAVFTVSTVLLPVTSLAQVIEVPQKGSGVVFIRAMVRAGSMHDPVGKEGLADFTATLLKRGAGKWTRAQIEQQLDQMGAELYTDTQKEFTMVIGRCLTSVLPEFYEIFSAVLTRPAFPLTQIEVSKRDQLEGINQIKNDNEDLGLEAFTHFIYQGSRWEHSTVGRQSAIKTFTQKEAQAFYRRHYGRNNIKVGIAGDYESILFKTDPQNPSRLGLKERLVWDLGKLPQIEALEAKAPSPDFSGRPRRVLIVEKEGLDQGQINIGMPLKVSRRDADYPALYIASQALGSHRNFTGQLMNSIRADRGLTYGAYAYIEYFPYPYHRGADMLPIMNMARSQQDFRVWSFTLAKNMDFTSRLMLLKSEELVNSGLTAKRFRQVQEFAKNKFVFLVEALERRMAMRLDDEIYGTQGEGFAATFERRLNDVTLRDLNAAVRKHIRPESLVFVYTVPDGKAFAAELLSDGANIEYQGGIDPKPLTAEDTKVKTLNLGIKAEHIVHLDVDRLFE